MKLLRCTNLWKKSQQHRILHCDLNNEISQTPYRLHLLNMGFIQKRTGDEWICSDHLHILSLWISSFILYAYAWMLYKKKHPHAWVIHFKIIRHNCFHILALKVGPEIFDIGFPLATWRGFGWCGWINPRGNRWIRQNSILFNAHIPSFYAMLWVQVVDDKSVIIHIILILI